MKLDGAGSFWSSWYEKAAGDVKALEVVTKYHLRPAQELFDLKKDPLEQNNLALDSNYKEILKKMDLDLHQWMKSQGDTEKVYNTPILKTEDFPIKNK